MVDRTPVEKPLLKRTTPASSPDGYLTLQQWLIDSTDRHGMPAELGRFCLVQRQNVTKWLTGSIPKGPTLRKRIAEWAQVDFEALNNLIQRDEAQRDPALKKPAQVVRKKQRLKRQG